MLAVELHKDLRRHHITGDFILAVILSKYKMKHPIINLSGYSDTRDALLYGFEWKDTPQGYNFWSRKYDKMY